MQTKRHSLFKAPAAALNVISKHADIQRRYAREIKAAGACGDCQQKRILRKYLALSDLMDKKSRLPR